MKIDSVEIKNFKSLKDIELKLSNLTLITGVNSSGKSSFIQSLLVFKENFDVITFEMYVNIYLNEENELMFAKKNASFYGKYL
jgi:predicted ATPase